MDTTTGPQNTLFSEQGTSSSLSSGSKIVTIPFGSYEVVVELDQNDRLLGIKEIRIPRVFLSLDQHRTRYGASGVDDLYEDDEA